MIVPHVTSAQTPRPRAGLPLLLVLALALAACGQSPAKPTPLSQPGSGAASPAATPPATPATPGSPAPMQRYRFKIEQLQVIVSQSQPAQVSAQISSYLPDSCTEALPPQVNRDGNAISVELLGQRPVGVACSQIARPFQQTIPLGSLPPGHYTLQVNDQQTAFDVP